MRRWWLALVFSIGCGGETGEDLRFPSGFRFGTATAGFQVDMGCPTRASAECDDPNSDWYVWVTRPELLADPGLALSGDPPARGPGMYELYPADFDRAAGELHGNTLRLSIEWSRLFPRPTFGLDGYDALRQAASPTALAYYHALFQGLRQRGLEPLVTLNHYTLPTWIHDAYGCHVDLAHCSPRGWLDGERTIGEIAKYAGFCAHEFGAEVDLWATENEPFLAVAVAGYFNGFGQRTVPPAVNLDAASTRAATLALIEAHARMVDAVRAADSVDADGDGRPARVGIVYNLQAVTPRVAGSDRDEQGAAHVRYLMNELFLNAVALGDLDENLDGNKVHRDDLAGRLDFLGVNYYSRVTVDGLDTSIFPQLSPLLTFNPLTLEIDPAYPRGLYEVLLEVKQYGVPILVTETGVADPDDRGGAADWVVATLTWVRRAMQAGVPVEGYYYWTLMDNYEWSQGLGVRLGLYAVDNDDPQKARRARSSATVYGRIAAAGEIPADLRGRVPRP
jgi:beta-glucosidase/6-phospho-beta-glucosidase/beta-galactosidase